MENPPITIKSIRMTPNGDGTHTVLLGYTDNTDNIDNPPQPQDPPPCACQTPKPTPAERRITRELQKIEKANQAISRLRHEAGTPPAQRTPSTQRNPLTALIPNRWPKGPSTLPEHPLTKSKRKLRNFAVGIVIGTLMAALYIVIKTT